MTQQPPSNVMTFDYQGKTIVHKYSSHGGYPIVYLTNHDQPYCPDCAYDAEWDLWADDMTLTPHCHMEGAAIECIECGVEIESAYGDPEADGGTEAPKQS